MASRQEIPEARNPPRLYLVTYPVDDVEPLLRALPDALAAGDVAAVLLRLPAFPEAESLRRIAAVAKPVQAAGAALILDGQPDLAARSGADGAHLTGIDAFKAGVARLKPALIAGAGGLKTRHDAMIAAESAADYVMFGEPDRHGERPAFGAVVERVTWWSEVFEIPCVGFADSFEEARALARAGTEFVALGEFVWNYTDGPAAAVEEAARHLRLAELV